MTDIEPVPLPETNHARVAPTAWDVAYLRTFTDIPLANEFFNALNAQLQQNGEPDVTTSADRDHLAPQLEARYKLVDKLIAATDSTQILELAAGVATQGINTTSANPNVTYVEVDLPGVVKEKRDIINSINVEMPSNLLIQEGDALKELDVRKATALFTKEKPVTVVNEGLMRYLTFEEKVTLARNIHGVLSDFGGSWITPDISLRQALSREDEASSGHTEGLIQTTGIDISQNVFDDQEHAKRFFEELGFDVEVHSFLEVTGQLVSPERLRMSDIEVKRLNEPCVAFVMTVKN